MEIDSDAGLVLQQVIELDAMQQSGVTISLADISPLEARGLVMLQEERQRSMKNEQAAEDMSAAGARIRSRSGGF